MIFEHDIHKRPDGSLYVKSYDTRTLSSYPHDFEDTVIMTFRPLVPGLVPGRFQSIWFYNEEPLTWPDIEFIVGFLQEHEPEMLEGFYKLL